MTIQNNKGIIFDTEKLAKEWDFEHNDFTGNETMYKWNRKPLIQTTTLTKEEYAEMEGIPATVSQWNEKTEESKEVENPDYKALADEIAVHKYALMVGDDLDTFDEEGERVVPENVVDVTDLLLTIDN